MMFHRTVTVLHVRHFAADSFLASPDAQEVIVVTESLSHSELADLTDVTLVSDDTFRRLGTWVTHDHLSSVIDWYDPSEWWYL